MEGLIIEAEVEHFTALVATGLKQLKDEAGINFDATIFQNEPDFTPEEVVRAVKSLRAELDARGLQSVKLIAPDSSSVDGRFYGMMDAIKTDGTAWNAITGIDTHSYNMAATPKSASSAVCGADGSNPKEYWMTEASDNGPLEVPGTTGVAAMRGASLFARFLTT